MVRPVVVGVSALGVQRVAELALARRNERAALARGAVEHGAAHYPIIVAMHAGWLAATGIEGWNIHRVRLGPLGAEMFAQVMRYWAIARLGPQWTTRVIVDPTAEPVRTGPYRWLRHPNYLAVAVEIAAFPLVFRAWRSALFFSVANALLLRHRIRVEERARSSPPRG